MFANSSINRARQVAAAIDGQTRRGSRMPSPTATWARFFAERRVLLAEFAEGISEELNATTRHTEADVTLAARGRHRLTTIQPAESLARSGAVAKRRAI